MLTKKIFIIAGEISGDQIGMLIIKKLSKKNNIQLSGVGGQHLKQIGLKSIFPMNKISVMGLVEIIPKIPELLSLIKYTLEKIEDYKPDLVITIDGLLK